MKTCTIKSLLVLLVVFITYTMTAQDKKEVVQKGIKVKRIYEQNIGNGDKEHYLEKEEFYSLKGDLVELKEYTNRGTTVKSWMKYSYDSNSQLIEERELNSKGEVIKRSEYKYENSLRIERIDYDSKDRIVKRKRYKYDIRE